MRRLLSFACLALAPLEVGAGQVVPKIPIESYALGNGLRVILSPDRSTQVVTVNVCTTSGPGTRFGAGPASPTSSST